jgi:hypothetical protein
MKKLAVFIVVFFFFATFSYSAEYWGSKSSNKYHNPTCKWAQKISPKNLVKFNSPEQAVKANYVPCKVCKPPASSKAELNTEDKIQLAVLTSIDPSEEKRGCCSWHGGVCGCSGGRALCCDGTLSPTCGCD